MNSVVKIVSSVFDHLLKPFDMLPATFGLFLVSAVAGIILLKLFGLVSNQRKIKTVKNQIKAYLLGMVLYRDDIRIMLGMQGRMLWENLKYLRLSLVPLIVLVIVCLPLMAQLNARYGYAPFRANEKVQIFVQADEPSLLNGMSIHPGDGVNTISPALRIPEAKEADWRIEVATAGNHTIEISSNGKKFAKRIVVGDEAGKKITPVRSAGLLDNIFYPGEDFLPKESGLELIRVDYPSGKVDVFGYKMHWLWIFCIVSIVSALAFKRWLKVEI
jgi:hypothetical protein